MALVHYVPTSLEVGPFYTERARCGPGFLLFVFGSPIMNPYSSYRRTGIPSQPMVFRSFVRRSETACRSKLAQPFTFREVL